MEIKFGKIIFQLANEESKSESVQPFLIEDDGTVTQVYLENENPFMNSALREFDGKIVAIAGFKNDGSTIFTIQAVKENPLASPPENSEAN